MNVGRLDRYIVIQEFSNVTNAIGEVTKSWSTFHECFAQLQGAGGSEKEEASKNTATRMVKFKIRFFDGITEDMRILYNGNYYDIHEIQELGREALWLKASKKL